MKLCFKKLRPDAVVPEQKTAFASGFDLTCIATAKVIGHRTTLYHTGLAVMPPHGYHTEIFPRSSIVKTGYILANSIGLIDNDYRGELLVALTKVDETLPDLVPPFCLTQLVLRKSESFQVELVEDLTTTVRGHGGFGSTDKVLNEIG